MAIPARKVFYEAVPVAEVAAQVLPDQASSVLLRTNAASIPPLNTKRQHGPACGTEQSAQRGTLRCTVQSWRDILGDEIPRSRVFAGFDAPCNSEYSSPDDNTVGRCPSRE